MYLKINLPFLEQITMRLNKNFGINKVKVEKWYDYFFDSFKALNLFENIPLTKSIQNNYENMISPQKLLQRIKENV